MTNFDLFKREVVKANTPEEFQNILEFWRYDKFPCEVSEKCIQDYTCLECYRSWLMKEID